MLLKNSHLSKRIKKGLRVFIAASLAVTGAVSAESAKVAFIGDQGIGENARAVLQLVAGEGAELLMIQGDLGYGRNAAAQWEANLNDMLGSNFPVLVVVGNHENYEWPAYKSLTKQRIDRAGGLSCQGDVGVKATCQFENLDIVQVAPGVSEVEGVSADDNYADFIRSSFSNTSDRWRICSWHKNQKRLQTGSKSDATGWDVYDACLDAGAMIAVAHEHAYSRSYLLSDFKNQTIVHKNNDMTLQSGQSFMFVSGLGGREARDQKRGGDWWASIYTASQGATSGALFCEFENAKAECYFKAIDGSVPDQFVVRRGEMTSASVTPSTAPQRAGYVFSRTDKEEYRWIDRNEDGGLGNIWIDRACAEKLGGPSVTGDWGDLDDIAPEMDSIASPCENDATASLGEGYVFSRSDTEEYRWIDRNNNGVMGSVWIDQTCAMNLGGVVASGDWGVLIDLAPEMDSIDSPCLEAEQALEPTASSGYVFSRTDIEEFRWIGQDDAGRTGNIWIDSDCAERLGGASIAGEWKDLNDLAPRFDAIPNPCD